GGDRDGGAAGAEVDGGEVVAHLPVSVTPPLGVAQPQLPEDVVAPALRRGVVEHRARVVAAGGERDGGAAGAEVDGGEVVAHFPRIGTPSRSVGQSQPPVVFAAPPSQAR